MDEKYAVVVEKNEKLNDYNWDTAMYYFHGNKMEEKQKSLSNAIEFFRVRTEDNYISRNRLIEIATKYKDALVENTSEGEVVDYSREDIDMDDEMLEFFGLDPSMENNSWYLKN